MLHNLLSYINRESMRGGERQHLCSTNLYNYTLTEIAPPTHAMLPARKALVGLFSTRVLVAIRRALRTDGRPAVILLKDCFSPV